MIAQGAAAEITSSETEAEPSNSGNDLLSSIDLSEVLVDSTSKVKESVREVASNYVINSTDIKKIFFNKGKKYRLLKVVKKDPKGNILVNGGTEDVIRNIKLEVDSKGNMKVPNLFKIKRKKNYKNYVRRHRQIYREDLMNFQKSKKETGVGEGLEYSSVTNTTPGPRTTRVAQLPDDGTDPPRVVSHGLPLMTHRTSHLVPPLHAVTSTPLGHVRTSVPALDDYRHTSTLVSPSPTHLTQRIVTPQGYYYTTKSSFVDVKFGHKHLLHSSTQSDDILYHSTSQAPIVPHHSETNTSIRPNVVTRIPNRSTKDPPHVHQSTLKGPIRPRPLTSTTIRPDHSPSYITKHAELSTTRTPSFQQKVSPPAPIVSQLSTRKPLKYSNLASTFYPTASPFQLSTYHSKIKSKETNTKYKHNKTSTTIGPALYDPQEEFILTTTVKPTTSPTVGALSTTTTTTTDISRPEFVQKNKHSKVAVGSRHHIDNLFQELEQGSTLTSLYDEKRNIQLVGPIEVRATGPKTFTIINPGTLEGYKPVKRDYQQSPNLIQDERLKLPKRPSLHFEPLNSKKKSTKFMTTIWPFVSSTQKLRNSLELGTRREKLVDESRRWPRSKPTKRKPTTSQRVDVGVDPRHSKHVRFEDLSKQLKKHSAFVRFPS